ncbi:unnamed protein product [Mycena citricolor]|uniref:WSC domain-containing protein n=1 Tax=Mycena citricolor TaxID=2018698 RepID=A0AAD2GXG9_9AGAR|nr:unnamed protein product [Mycena citricolor]
MSSVLSLTPLLLLPFVHGADVRVLSRQTNPANLPANWSLAGCFTDVSVARTLAASSAAGPNMTVASCINFCAGEGYIFAGVEFGDECCASTTFSSAVSCSRAFTYQIATPRSKSPEGKPRSRTVQSPAPATTARSAARPADSRSTPVARRVPCSCQTQQPDGLTKGVSRIDNTANRTLPVPINVPVGVTAETCTAACMSAGKYVWSGLENGHECWCGSSVGGIAAHVSDDDCRAVCSADHTEYCGNANRLALYGFTSADAPPPPPQTCETTVSNFTLLAVYRNPPVGGPKQVNVRAVLVELVPNTFWTILSACATCCSDWPTFTLQNSVFHPHSFSNPVQSMTSIGAADGESPAFVASSPPFPGTQAYCAQQSAINLTSPPLLSFGGQSDSWSLCTNTSLNANGRIDLVHSPVTNHPNYLFSSCNAVDLLVMQN